MSADDGTTTASIRQFVLDKESELRVEVGPEDPLRLRLTTGAAEVFGAELPPGKWITVPALQNIAIFTWNGATIELDGISEVEYVADETPMVSYVNVHAILDGRRARMRTSDNVDSSQGPRTIVVGPTDSGKSSLCRMLLNWACKRSWKPTFVDLDVGQGSITMPGCISASSVEMPMDAFWGIPTEMPVVYLYGHTSASANVELYKVLMKELAQTLERRFSCIPEYEAAGMEKLFSMLRDVLKSKPHVDIVKLYKSDGVALRNQKVRQMSRSYKIRVLRRLGTNVYLLDLPSSVDTSPVFNVANLTAYDSKPTDAADFETLPVSQSIIPEEDPIEDVVDIRTTKTQ